MSLLVTILCILFFGAVLLLVILNHGATDINLFFRTYPQVPIAVVMVVSLLVGIAFTSFVSVIDGIRVRIQNRRLRRKVARLENEMELLRTSKNPVRDPAETESTPPADYYST